MSSSNELDLTETEAGWMEKPAGSKWTDEQWEAIRTRGSNVLVAAAAGSGKTAVLVERIIKRITDDRHPIDVDQLLVATFTNAAAGEMRQRIREALEKELQRNPQSSHLLKQISLIHRASITTLHSFCLEIVHRYFSRVQLDPSFRIANETEAELMRQDLLMELLEEQYGTSEENSPFWQLVDWFGGERGDEALFRLIQRLYDFSRSHPWPEFWLQDIVAAFQGAGDETEDNGNPGNQGFEAWTASLLRDVRLELRGIGGVLGEALQLASRPDGPDAYIDNLRADSTIVEELLEASNESWERLYERFQGASFGKLNASRGSSVNKDVQEMVKKQREQAKKKLYALHEELFERTPEQYRAELAAMAPVMAKLAELVALFGERFRQQKAERGLVDFADLEHYCLQILRHPDSTPGHVIPSDAAEELRSRFSEVLLDEYQDTNMVQEAIVELIAKHSPGNRFMVGDVKQSIYRFRLAEPGLFLQKYGAYKDRKLGHRIDLARNFRSRSEVVDGVNFLFKQLMSESVAEMDYDESAQLIHGAGYPPSPNNVSLEVLLIDKGGTTGSGADSDEESETLDSAGDGEQESNSAETASGPAEQEEQAETAQLEARLIAATIRKLRGETGESPFRVYDRGLEGYRALEYRDIVILLRSPSNWSSVMLEELKQAGIPVYAELNSGYFTATEVETLLSLLQVIDNPYQDIPLAGVLRSPIVQLTEEELAHIRLFQRSGPYFDAMLACSAEVKTGDGDPVVEGEPTVMERLRAKLRSFLTSLSRWQEAARLGSLADLIWSLLRETGFYDYVGGLAGGLQRQANLKALYDRARQYEATSFRGLYRFLRFIERMQDNGGDLGTARALGEQEDVVRIMSIHKSKGLEFPVVFVAALGKRFNMMDLNGSFLMHKQLGFGPKFVDTALRVSYPTFPLLAMRKRMRMEMLAEELRVLYVALTRPKEKLFLIGTTAALDKQAQKWGGVVSHPEWALPDYELAKAKCFLDWLGPALMRHPQAGSLRAWGSIPEPTLDAKGLMQSERSEWTVAVIGTDSLAQAAAAMEGRFADERMEAIAQLSPIAGFVTPRSGQVKEVLQWRNPRESLSQLFSKTSVTELKRIADQRRFDEEEPGMETAVWLPGMARAEKDQEVEGSAQARLLLARRPKFMEQKKMNAAERGTVYHAVMQHLPLNAPVTTEVVIRTMDDMVARELLTAQQRAETNGEPIDRLFGSPLGQRLLQAEKVYREVPFSYGLKAGEIYPNLDETASEEMILIQGVIDCLFEEQGELLLLDYKTDAVYGDRLDLLVERYRVQLNLYAHAIEQIWKRPIKGKILYFFDGSHEVWL